MKYIVNVLKTDLVTHNVKRFVVEKPPGYSFVPGQATDVAIHKPGLENELRPFTFTCLPDANYLEFIIKIYRGHAGMTEKLLEVNAGDHLVVHDVFGTIHYEGPGLFIAAGAGITPFLAIFRHLHQQEKLDGNTLLFANRTEDDTILKAELKDLLGANYEDVIESPASGKGGKRIDLDLLKLHVTGEKQICYVCGPEKFTVTMVEALQQLGVKKSQIIIEQ